MRFRVLDSMDLECRCFMVVFNKIDVEIVDVYFCYDCVSILEYIRSLIKLNKLGLYKDICSQYLSMGSSIKSMANNP